MTRQQINAEIIKILSECNEMLPDQRFNQILINLNLSLDHRGKPMGQLINYHEESQETLDRITKQIETFRSWKNKK